MSAASAGAWPRVAAVVIVLLAFGLRVAGLGHQELRGDEAFGYFFAQRDFTEIIDATIELQEPHPVASYFVQRAWLGVAGDSEFALRFPSAWFGVLAVALLLRLAMRLGFRRGPALLAMALLAISPYAIWHAQDARMLSRQIRTRMKWTMTRDACICERAILKVFNEMPPISVTPGYPLLSDANSCFFSHHFLLVTRGCA